MLVPPNCTDREGAGFDLPLTVPFATAAPWHRSSTCESRPNATFLVFDRSPLLLNR
jgi:hypothetical protein